MFLYVYDMDHITIFSFMDFLYTHLEPGSFRPAYVDTDSMCLGLSKTAVPKDDTPEAYYR